MQQMYTSQKQLLRWEDWVGDTSRDILVLIAPGQDLKILQLELSIGRTKTVLVQAISYLVHADSQLTLPQAIPRPPHCSDFPIRTRYSS